jgi:CBS domain containing-hemolysin-like protein
MSVWVWTVIAVLILANALYVAAEFGAVGVRRSRVRRLSDEGSLLARRLLPFVESASGLDRYVAVSQVGITLSSLVLGAFGQATVAVALAPAIASSFGLNSDTAASTAAIVVLVALTVVQVVASELVPKSLALQFPTQVALATVLPMQWSLAAFRPLIALLNGSANGLLRLLRIHTTPHRHIHAPEEIDLLIAESRDGGLLEADEQRRLHRALRLSLRSARDLMVPRERLTMLRLDMPWDEVVKTAAANPYSRLPVYRDTPEQVVGMLRVKDLATHYVSDGRPAPLERLMRPVERIRHDLPADQVLAALRDRRAHQAVVIGDSDRVIGLITIQDVLGAFLGRDAPPAGERA